MAETSQAEYYHEQTKYTPEGIARGGRGLDMKRQPVPFKDYPHGTSYDLTRYLPEGDELRSDETLAAWRAALPPEERPWAELSHLLYFTNGVTAVVHHGAQPFLMRAAPSAGGLYPTEIYLAARGHAVLPDGLYNYGVREHALVRFWTGDPREAMNAATFDHPDVEDADLVVLFTGVYERSVWRYEDRAYRRILLDTGHVIGNMAIYAPQVGRKLAAVGGFADEDLDHLLFLEPGEEGVLAVAALVPLDGPVIGPSALPGPVVARREVPEGQRLYALHDAGSIPSGLKPGPAPVPKPPEPRFSLGASEPLDAKPMAWDAEVGPTILRRRSTREFSGEGLTRDELVRLLDYTYRPDLDPAQIAGPALFAGELLQTYIAVHDVEGLDPGCWFYDPLARTLRQTRFTALRAPVGYLALGQDLAATAGAVVFHTADLPAAVARYGDRAYRYLHLDAGQLGERLNVAAIRLGLGVSGIGGFFDDQVNDTLGIPDSQAVLYLTTLGRPEDH